MNIEQEESDSIIESKNEEAINSEAFYKGFSICLKKMENIENYSYILNKIKSGTEAITYDEYNSLEKLLKDDKFIKIANNILNKSINFSRTKDEHKNFDISIDSMKKYLLNTIYTSLITKRTTAIIGESQNNETNELEPEFSNDFIEVYYRDKSDSFIKYKSTGEINKFRGIIILNEGVIGAEIEGKGFILLNKKGEQTSKEGTFYKKVSILKNGLIKANLLVNLAANDIMQLYDKNGEIMFNGDLYTGVIELENGPTIIVKGIMGSILLNERGKEISNSNYALIDRNNTYEYFNKTGLFQLSDANKKYFLLNKHGAEIDRSESRYSYDDDKKQFYKIETKSGFAGILGKPKKIYIENQK